MQLAPRGAKRCTAFGIFDSLEDANSLASAEYVEDDNSVGRLQLTLTSTLKTDLIDCLMQYFPHESTTQQIINDTPPRDSIPKRKDVSLDEMEEESALSSNDETRDDSFGCVSFDADDFSYDYSPHYSEIVGQMLERECSTDHTESEVERHIRLMTRQEEIIAQLKSLQQEYQENRKMLGESGGGQSIHYIMDGLACKIMLDEHEMLSLDDFKTNLEPIPPSLDNNVLAETRKKRNYEVAEYGSSTVWIPRGTILHAKNQQSKISDSKAIIDALIDIFAAGQTTLSKKAKMYLALGKLWAPGCSDEGAIMIMVSTVKCILSEIKQRTRLTLPISNDDIARCMPSRATLVESETEIAALCLLRTSQDLIDNKVPMVAGLCDHGTRRDVHHFPTSIHYPVQVKGQWRMKHATLSIDKAGHTADDCVDAWERSLNRLPGVDFFAHRINISNNDGALGGGAESSDGSSAADSTAVDDDTETNDNTEPSDSTAANMVWMMAVYF